MAGAESSSGVLYDLLPMGSGSHLPLYSLMRRPMPGIGLDLENYLDSDIVVGDTLTKSQYLREGGKKIETKSQQESSEDVNEGSTLDIRYKVSFYAQLLFLCKFFAQPRCVAKQAYEMIKNVVSRVSMRNRPIDAITAASFASTLEKRKVDHISGEQVMKALEVSEIEYDKAVKVVKQAADTKSRSEEMEDAVHLMCAQLAVKPHVKSLAVQMGERAVRLGVCVKRKPVSVAAGIIYLATWMEGVKRTQEDIARIADLTQVTMRKVRKELEPHLSSLIPDEYEPKIKIGVLKSVKGEKKRSRHPPEDDDDDEDDDEEETPAETTAAQVPAQSAPFPATQGAAMPPRLPFNYGFLPFFPPQLRHQQNQ
eukprot:CAMPEP_0113892092 /NCGR_PEP_ID=MMETSP0780_2-20120614/15190_1 /TAXON_ID=652834 /ORGANISM="Palpitomonas bilix" /LENGTH=366 /DNA_ID=CAMNT_0000881923 /DNA_START=84 /DNA_END=1184 /DNA_ORIENTATION=- /assembly_acc=CAM_ASM_000599